VLATLAVVVGTRSGVHAWGFWWVIPVGLLVARRLAGRRSMERGFRDDIRRDFRGEFRGEFRGDFRGGDFREH
jgi:hypothetical protein